MKAQHQAINRTSYDCIKTDKCELTVLRLTELFFQLWPAGGELCEFANILWI